MNTAAAVLLGVVIGMVVLVLTMTEGKSGKCLVDKFDDWCKKHLPW